MRHGDGCVGCRFKSCRAHQLFFLLLELPFGKVGLEEAVRGGFAPGGLPEVAEVLGAGFELDLQENFSGGGGFWAEPFVFVQLIKGFHLLVLGEDEVEGELEVSAGEVTGEGTHNEFSRAEGAGEGGAIRGLGGLEEATVDPRVEAAAGGVVFWVVAYPAVEVFGGVEGLGGVANVVAEDSHSVNDVGARVIFFFFGSHFFKNFEVGKCADEFEVVFVDGPRQKTGMAFGVVGVGFGQFELEVGAGVGHLLDVAVAEMAEVGGLKLVGVEVFKVEVMIEAVEVAQGTVAVIAPAIGFAAEEKDALAIGGQAHEGWKILGERGEREVVDEPVPLVIPSVGGEGKQKRCDGCDDTALVLHTSRLKARAIGRN